MIGAMYPMGEGEEVTPPTVAQQLELPGQISVENLITDEIRTEIDGMSQQSIAQLIRFGASGNVLLTGRNYDYLMARFNSLGGWTPEISKAVGW